MSVKVAVLLEERQISLVGGLVSDTEFESVNARIDNYSSDSQVESEITILKIAGERIISRSKEDEREGFDIFYISGRANVRAERLH